MSYQLFIMDRAYSSWSLRGHLLLAGFGITYRPVHAHWPGPEFDEMMKRIPPARTVPALEIRGSGAPVLVWDTIAIAETLAERHPEIAFWPKAPAARAAARSLAAEMHGGFSALRSECPMNIRKIYAGFQPSKAVLADVERAQELWAWARENFGGEGPFLFGGEITVADAFFLPLATRMMTFGLPVREENTAYIDALHRLPAFRRWRAMALATSATNRVYEFNLPVSSTALPGATPLPAKAVEGREPINELCPYSGHPVSPDSIAEIDGTVIGYCNPFCRDKTVADAEAWPETVQLLCQAGAA